MTSTIFCTTIMPTNLSLRLFKEIPSEVRFTIKGLGDDVRLATLVALMKKQQLTFTELKKILGVNSSSLSYHLSLLQDGGLVSNFVTAGDKLHSYYSSTELAESVLGSLYDIILGIPSEDISARKQLTAQTSETGTTSIVESSLSELPQTSVPAGPARGARSVMPSLIAPSTSLQRG